MRVCVGMTSICMRRAIDFPTRGEILPFFSRASLVVAARELVRSEKEHSTTIELILLLYYLLPGAYQIVALYVGIKKQFSFCLFFYKSLR